MPLPTKAIIHPLVFLSAVDHYKRLFEKEDEFKTQSEQSATNAELKYTIEEVADTKQAGELKEKEGQSTTAATAAATTTSKQQALPKRAVGILLGNAKNGIVEVTNSFAVPFSEDEEDEKTWFFDHTFAENMFDMMHRVDAREHVVGWYASGPRTRPADMDIHQLLYKYTPNPIYVILNVHLTESIELPATTFVAREEFVEETINGKTTSAIVKQFHQIGCEVGTLEAEEIGVSHLLRDVRGSQIATADQKIQNNISAVEILESKIKEIAEYLTKVSQSELPINQTILEKVQNVLNLSQNLTIANEAFTSKTNDMLRVLYLSSLMKAIVAVHDLIRNKYEYRRVEDEFEKKIKEKEKQ